MLTKTLEKLKRTNNFHLYYSVCTINLVTFTVGTAFSWPSPSLPKLLSPDPDINPLGVPITHQEAGWIASLVLLGTAIGPFTTALLYDRIGRKKTLYVFIVPIIAGYLIKAFATSTWVFYLARFLCGLTGGAVFSLVPIYVGEIAQDSNRGALGIFLVIFLCLGNFYTYTIGPYVSVRVYSLVCLLGPALFLVMFPFVPESAHFLLAKNRYEEGERALCVLRNSSETAESIKTELKQIKSCVDSAKAESGTKSQSSSFAIFQDRTSRKAFLIGVILVLFQQFSGIFAFVSYMQVIFKDTGSTIPADISTIIIGIVQILSCVFGAAIVDKFGRKVLLVASAIGMALAQFLIGAYFHFQSVDADFLDKLFWLPVLSLILFMVSFNPGFGSIPWMLLGEIFTQNVRAVGSSLITCIGFIAAFTITTTFPVMVESLGSSWSFWFFGICSVVGCVYTVIAVPETKGKTFEEIQELLGET